MPLPETIRVKLSSEAAEAIALTPVVVQELPLRDLVEHMLGVTGKDEQRVIELLRRGTLVSGASRFRWPGWEADLETIRALLATFPDPDPNRPFAAASCVRAVLRGGRHSIELTREAGTRKPLFKSSSFWDVLMEVAASTAPHYTGYSYRHRTDTYQVELPLEAAERLRAAHGLAAYSSLRDPLRSLAITTIDLYVSR